MKVLQVILHGGIGGMETFARSLHKEISPDVEFQTISLDKGPRQPSSPPRRVQTAVGHIRRFRPDLLLTHSALPNLYGRLANVGTRPVVTVLHSGGDDYRFARLRHAEHILLPTTSAVIAVSNRVAQTYLRRFPQAEAKMYVIPNGVQAPRLIPTPSTSTGLPHRLIFAGRLVPMKQLHVLLEALDHVDTRHEWTLTIAGHGLSDYETACRHLANRLRTKNRIRFIGGQDDIYPLLEQSDLLIHPSLYEAQGLTLLEAAMHGLPSVVTHDVERHLSPRHVAIPFSAENVYSLADVLNRCLSTLPSLRKAAVSAAPHFIATGSIAHASRRYSEVLRMVSQS